MSSLPASIIRIGTKTTKKGWRHRFPHYKSMEAKTTEKRWWHHFPCYISMGGFLLPWKPEFWSNLPQNLMQPFPHPSDATHKIWSRLANWLHRYSGERGGSVVECRTPEREVRGSRPTAAVLCPWARHFTPRKYWLITQEAMAPSRHVWKIVDWDVKPQHNQPNHRYSRLKVWMTTTTDHWYTISSLCKPSAQVS